MRTLICGSIAYDTIMVFGDRFKNHILPDQIHILNVAFLVPEIRREFGGCAGNIAYTLKSLGDDPLIMATVGEDYQPYAYRLEKLRLSQEHVLKVKASYTAQAFITTDLDDNQITAFEDNPEEGAPTLVQLNTGKSIEADFVGCFQQYRPFNDVTQFANIAGPIVLLQNLGGQFGYRCYFVLLFGTDGRSFEEIFSQKLNVLFSLR